MRGHSLVLVSMLAACSSDPYALEHRARTSVEPTAPKADPNAPPQAADAQFHALEKRMIGKCGGCHRDGAYKPLAPQFLLGDAYATLKAYPGAVVADPYESVLLTKGAHAGPGISPDTDPAFYNSVKGWLD